MPTLRVGMAPSIAHLRTLAGFTTLDISWAGGHAHAERGHGTAGVRRVRLGQFAGQVAGVGVRPLPPDPDAAHDPRRIYHPQDRRLGQPLHVLKRAAENVRQAATAPLDGLTCKLHIEVDVVTDDPQGLDATLVLQPPNRLQHPQPPHRLGRPEAFDHHALTGRLTGHGLSSQVLEGPVAGRLIEPAAAQLRLGPKPIGVHPNLLAATLGQPDERGCRPGIHIRFQRRPKPVKLLKRARQLVRTSHDLTQPAVLVTQGPQKTAGLVSSTSRPLRRVGQSLPEHGYHPGLGPGPIVPLLGLQACDPPGGGIKPKAAGAGLAEQLKDVGRILLPELNSELPPLLVVRTATATPPLSSIQVRRSEPVVLALDGQRQHRQQADGRFERSQTGQHLLRPASSPGLVHVQQGPLSRLGSSLNRAQALHQQQDFAGLPLKAPDLHLVHAGGHGLLVIQTPHHGAAFVHQVVANREAVLQRAVGGRRAGDAQGEQHPKGLPHAALAAAPIRARPVMAGPNRRITVAPIRGHGIHPSGVSGEHDSDKVPRLAQGVDSLGNRSSDPSPASHGRV
jgi:hypothetical protein